MDNIYYDAGRLYDWGKIDDLSSGFALAESAPFTIFVTPTSSNTTPPDVIVVPGTPYKSQVEKDSPIVINAWAENLFNALAISAIDLTQYDVYWGCGNSAEKAPNKIRLSDIPIGVNMRNITVYFERQDLQPPANIGESGYQLAGKTNADGSYSLLGTDPDGGVEFDQPYIFGAYKKEGTPFSQTDIWVANQGWLRDSFTFPDFDVIIASNTLSGGRGDETTWGFDYAYILDDAE